MQYFNGSDYDTLYPQTQYSNIIGTPSFTFDNITGVVPIDKGGTGQNNANDGLGSLINSCTSLSSANSSDYIGIYDASASSGRKISVSSLANYIKSAVGQGLKFGTYTGNSPADNLVETGDYDNWRTINIGTSYSLLIFFDGLRAGGENFSNMETSYVTSANVTFRYSTRDSITCLEKTSSGFRVRNVYSDYTSNHYFNYSGTTYCYLYG